jgi:hypothetical protein
MCVHCSYPDSLDLLREGLQGYRTRLGDKHPYVADSLCAISHVLGAMGKVTAAHKVLTQASFIYDCALKANNTQTSAQTTSTNNQLASSSKQTIVQTNSDFMSKTRGFGLLQMALGANKHLAGKYKDSFQHYSSALTVFTRRAKCLRVEAEMNVAHSLLGLANSLRCLCAYNKSKGLLGKAGVMIVKIFGESHVCVSECLCVGHVAVRHGQSRGSLWTLCEGTHTASCVQTDTAAVLAGVVCGASKQPTVAITAATPTSEHEHTGIACRPTT